MRTLISTLVMSLLIGVSQAQALQFSGPFAQPLHPEFTRWYRSYFAEFKRAYIQADGSVIDPENGGITHSEGQAYGMLIALIADDPDTFERVWRFARIRLKRPDQLFSWKYVPGHSVVDVNNASDADVLIASTLALAADRWKRPDYLQQAAATADAIGRHLLEGHLGRVLLKPAIHGFGAADLPDGPVINLSYYHFSALRNVAELAPGYPFAQMMETGMLLKLRAMELGTTADWVSVADPVNPRPAATLPSGFGYDAIRIAWNLLVAESEWQQIGLAMLDAKVAGAFEATDQHGNVLHAMSDPGYDLLAQALECAVHGDTVPMRLLDFDPTTYYASALHLMTIALLYSQRPECIPTSS